MADLKRPQTYKVARLNESMVIDADWDKPQWQKVEPLDVALFMGEKPEHLPKTQVKVLYDDDSIYVIFRVQDRYVRALATKPNGNVWEDSCVEFFLTPAVDVSQGYFNLETNAIGAILSRYQINRDENVRFLEQQDYTRIEIAHSLPAEIIDPEIKDPTTWTLEYRFPVDILENYHPVVNRPAPGVKWRANFFKCADMTSHPHWLTWSFIDKPSPDFHRPEYFGTLEFVD